jgi:hypothetical protein
MIAMNYLSIIVSPQTALVNFTFHSKAIQKVAFFRVTPTSGKLQPRQSQEISIKFSPKNVCKSEEKIRI